MGIESDQLVFDYLSRVGDVAHQRQMSSGDRMRLVSSLRSEIERRRGDAGGDTTAGVKRILGRLGAPETVVGSAAGGSARPGATDGSGGGYLPRQPTTPPASAPSGPHLAGMDERGPGPGLGKGGTTDWWRVQPGPAPGDAALGRIQVGGFVGGVEIPEILRPPGHDGASTVRTARLEKSGVSGAGEEADGSTAEYVNGAGDADGTEVPARTWWRRNGASGGAGRFGLTSPVLLLTAAVLVVGAVLGNIWALLAGWVLAYFSRTLTRSQAKVAVFWLPGVSVAGGLVWLWGRFTDRWGKPIPDGAMGQALSDTWPVVVRVAALASALFLVWRSRRGR